MFPQARPQIRRPITRLEVFFRGARERTTGFFVISPRPARMAAWPQPGRDMLQDEACPVLAICRGREAVVQ